MTVQSAAIRLGIDLGNTRVRAAYVFPDGGRTAVTLPVSPGPFGGRLPICERLPVNDPYLPPFFPGLSQRIERDFDVRVGHDRRTTMQLISHIVVHTADMARNFSGAIVDGIMLTLPAWQLPSPATCCAPRSWMPGLTPACWRLIPTRLPHMCAPR